MDRAGAEYVLRGEPGAKLEARAQKVHPSLAIIASLQELVLMIIGFLEISSCSNSSLLPHLLRHLCQG